MKKGIVFLLALICLLPIFGAGTKESAPSDMIELRFLGMAQAAYSEQNVNDMTADFMKAHPNIKVSTEFVPYEELRNKTLLAYSSNNSYDAVLVDDIWFTEYDSKGMLTDITADIPKNYRDGVLTGGWNFTTKHGKVVGLPWFLDTMYLFYNKSMLQKAGFSNPPKSIEEMVDMGRALKAKGIVEYPFVFSLAQAEALICVYSNFLEAYGGSFQDAQGNYILDKTGVKALDLLVSLKKEGLLNPNSLEFLEEDVRRVFSTGDAAFTLNWGYMYALASDPAESKLSKADVGVMVLPGAKGVKDSAAMSGSMGLSVLTKSKHPAEALQYILYLSSKEVQDTYSNLQLPVWSASYDDPKVRAGREDLADAAKKAFSIMNVRPSVPNYQEVSAVFQQYIQNALYGEKTPQQALAEAVQKVKEMK
ncbi:extracellular solute-binding protein [Sphaerochaeta sp.]|uniref:extracellular solute-binding protein n=1 Tax=Sphaerochaeta sp. TaxID=1972642 RepID=UPI002FCC886A